MDSPEVELAKAQRAPPIHARRHAARVRCGRFEHKVCHRQGYRWARNARWQREMKTRATATKRKRRCCFVWAFLGLCASSVVSGQWSVTSGQFNVDVW